MKSMTIGIREAKAELSRLLKEVEQGAEWVITDRGRPVAKLVPVTGDSRSLDEQVSLLERWGWIERPKKSRRSLPPPLPLSNDIAQRLLQQDRDA